MGNKIDKVVEGLYLGDISGARDEEGMKALGITHVLSLRLKEEEIHPGKFKYLCIEAPNFPDSDISKHFNQCIEFIHSALLSGGCVLIHCMGGIVRSPTVTCAYFMTATSLNLDEALAAIKKVRDMVDPSPNFLEQLRVYEKYFLEKERKRLAEKFPKSAELKERLEAEMKSILSN